MVDIHSHILPGLDDGAATLEEAVAMVRMAAASGTTDIVATPHADLKYIYDPAAVSARAGELREAAGGDIRIYTGCEFHLTPENIDAALREPCRFAINRRSYLLVELPETPPPSLEDILNRLLEGGMIPVLTHPERNPYVQRNLVQLEEWVRGGSLVQVTADALLGRFGRRAEETAGELMRRSLVHFIASDAHDTRHRTPSLREARDWTVRHCGEPWAELLLRENPGAALDGRPLPHPPASPRRRRWWPFR